MVPEHWAAPQIVASETRRGPALYTAAACCQSLEHSACQLAVLIGEVWGREGTREETKDTDKTYFFLKLLLEQHKAIEQPVLGVLKVLLFSQFKTKALNFLYQSINRDLCGFILCPTQGTFYLHPAQWCLRWFWSAIQTSVCLSHPSHCCQGCACLRANWSMAPVGCRGGHQWAGQLTGWEASTWLKVLSSWCQRRTWDSQRPETVCWAFLQGQLVGIGYPTPSSLGCDKILKFCHWVEANGTHILLFPHLWQ